MKTGLVESSSLYSNFKKLTGVTQGVIDVFNDGLTPSITAAYKAAELMTAAQETYKSKEEERNEIMTSMT